MVVTGDFYGVMHSINGVSLVKMIGISGHHLGLWLMVVITYNNSYMGP